MWDIRRALRGEESGEIRIRYCVPWCDPRVIERGSVDLVYSQAVLEHVTNLEATYGALWEWLRPAGVMSHQIDFRCHGMAPAWNGHWAYPNFLRRVDQGRRPYLLNRAPSSNHLAAMQNQGFRCGHTARVETPSPLSRSELARPFRDLTDEDLCTSGAYIQAVRD